jgi:hypothetical protein
LGVKQPDFPEPNKTKQKQTEAEHHCHTERCGKIGVSYNKIKQA